MKTILIVFIIVLISSHSFSQIMFKSTSDLIQAEYDFAAEAKENGVRDSFLKFIADDGILFRPHPVSGKEFLSKQEKRPGFLLWYPSFSVVSEAGDLGFNTGPWEYKRTADDASIAFGNFVTVWKKQKDGRWKFLMDIGNSNLKPLAEITALNPSDYRIIKGDVDYRYSDKEKKELFENEKSFSQASSSKNLMTAYKMYTTNETIYIRDNNFPFKGDEVLKYLDTLHANQTWESMGGAVALSGDLGYTYGKITSWKDSGMKGQDYQLYYLRCWYKENGNWKILIDVANVIPEEKQ